MEANISQALSGDIATLNQLSGIGSFLWVVLGAIGTGAFLAIRWLLRRAEDRRRAKYTPTQPIAERRVFGRDTAIREIHAILTPQETGAPPVVALTGGPGRGKSTLARAYNRTHADGARVKWINAATRRDMLVNFADEVLGLGEGKGPPEQRAALAKQHIEHAVDAKWLLVFDNVEDREQIGAWAPVGSNIRVLITTRRADWPDGAFCAYPVGLLAPEDAVALLQARAGRPDDGAAALAEELGYLPLGLTQAGEWLAQNPRESFNRYGERLTELIDRKVAPLTGQADYPDATGPAIYLSLDAVSRDARALLDIAAFLDLDRLDAKLLSGPATKPFFRKRHEYYRPISWRVWRLCRDERRLLSTIDELARRSILEPSDHGYSLHRLTAAVLRTRLGVGADKAAAASAAVIAASYPGIATAYANWPDCARLTPHVAALHRHPPATAAMDYLYNQAAIYLDQQAERETALAYAEAGLRLTTARLGPGRREVGLGHATLGLRLNSLGRLEPAEAHLRDALRISEALGAVAAEDLPKDLSNLAGVLQDLGVRDRAAGDPDAAAGRFDEAEGLLRRALDLAREQEDRAGEATCLNNLADLKAVMGDFPAAIGFAEQAVEIRKEIQSPDDPLLATSLNTLGGLRLRARDPAAARAPLQRALAIREAVFPDRRGRPPHPHRVNTAQWLATCLFALEPPETAAAEALCARYGLDPEELSAAAKAFMAPGG